MKKAHEILREKRLEKDIQQKWVAMTLGIPQSVVSDYETGRHRLSADRFVKWASILELELSDFIKSNDNKSKFKVVFK